MLQTLLRNLATTITAAITAPSLRRDPRWTPLERRLKKEHPTCIACGRADWIEEHHELPVHESRRRGIAPEAPWGELDPEHIVSMCNPWKRGGCHLGVGHRDPKTGKKSWSLWNPNVRADAAAMLEQFWRK